MNKNVHLFCEVFLNGVAIERCQLIQWIADHISGTISSSLVFVDSVEIDVRNNPRLKNQTPKELTRLRDDIKRGFVFSPFTLEIEARNGAVTQVEYVAAVRKLLDQLRQGGFEVHVASDLEHLLTA